MKFKYIEIHSHVCCLLFNFLMCNTNIAFKLWPFTSNLCPLTLQTCLYTKVFQDPYLGVIVCFVLIFTECILNIALKFTWPLTPLTFDLTNLLPHQNWPVHAMRWPLQPWSRPLTHHEPHVRSDAERGELHHMRHVPHRLKVSRGVWGHVVPPAEEREGVAGPPRLHPGLRSAAEGLHSDYEVSYCLV